MYNCYVSCSTVNFTHSSLLLAKWRGVLSDGLRIDGAENISENSPSA